MWNNVEAAPADPILGLTEAFKSDSRADKVNLGVGVYQDKEGCTPVLDAVKQAEKILLENETTKSYMPISGATAYAAEVQKMIFGVESNRAATVHTPGGTGALRLAGELFKDFSSKTVWVSNPTWANHKNIFAAAGLSIKEYPYYCPATKALDEEAFFAALETVPAGDCVLLHVCCHNPTGVDLSVDQWNRVAKLAVDKGWTALLDFAYQGFSVSIEADRAGAEAFLASGADFMVASSFSKNFGLYRERTGALTVVGTNTDAAAVAMSHMKRNARVLWSNPPAHGGQIVTTILQNRELSQLWVSELGAMHDRIAQTRAALADGLAERGVAMDCSFMTAQKGMFSFSGLTKEQVHFLKEEKAIYIVDSGRINVAGLTSGNLDRVCNAVAEAMSR
ncbi:amino acid aminotransferase [Tichowtungia aerotolerans]|uniref:Aminotransferase class I/II-fold pyridoxal phosphate-dependent enzyme n=1 Tax=Tichowtungia aerotolerans TaxID=2697043 RepID=A0A6P1M5F0_9BACT|nr:amino acid aminotransferase [Tichowtungia aerotolerans]QHI69077.1 aminotransferase class I/II-fold pyridoxal phosphate-dependent enzyme [Tichowtungia aerotolerans]